jgi:hypothetical protein
MARHRQQIWIDCEPQDLFEVLMDPDANRYWQTGVVNTRSTACGLATVGTTMTEDREFAGCRATIVYELIELDWPFRAVVQLVDGPLRGTASYTARAVAGGTMFTATSDICAHGRWRYAGRALAGVLSAELALSCQRLKGLLETPVGVPVHASQALSLSG